MQKVKHEMDEFYEKSQVVYTIVEEFTEKHRFMEEAKNDAKRRATLTEERARVVEVRVALLEIELPKKDVEEFNGNEHFKDVAEEFLSNKIREFYENLLGQIQGVNPDFSLEKVDIMSYFIQWKNDQVAKRVPLPVDKEGFSTEGQDGSFGQSPGALE